MVMWWCVGEAHVAGGKEIPLRSHGPVGSTHTDALTFLPRTSGDETHRRHRPSSTWAEQCATPPSL